jgi:integrase
MLAAKKLALQIEQDIALGQFDTTLSRYTGKKSTSSKLSALNFTDLFEHWVKNYKQMDCEVHTNYNSTRNMIRKWGKVDSSNIVQKLNSTKNAAVTYNRRLTILKDFCSWIVTQQIWDRNPLLLVKRKKVKTVKPVKREPFTESEIKQVLDAFKNNTACSRYAATKHSFYYPFMYFLFKTGVRNAEAIGLRVKHIDHENKVIHIKEVLARTLKSTTSKNRVRKSTKNEKERVLPLTPDLMQVLAPLIEGKLPDDLVFYSPTGKAIDDNNFRKRIFTKVLDHLGIPVRVLYATRHTFGSRCIDEGITPVMTAFLMGNNPETALRRYTHQINIPKSLPEL